ncbi:hypothetical protein T440DRAFT_502719 [Plenodomus tracheiphilus IPT5]|uniref:C2H2-type domain-containing protein n=1 Tax=Plenodomus tracheiphilus IPT5 TaxID=1408161 RepID=A0A6A7AP15_9PLEO|nr:hypothetical protein T440DRAFT_502719 [Plenodomus tracheiphilus IPT5]
MSPSTKRTTTRASAIPVAVRNFASTRKVFPSYRSNPSSVTDSDSCWEGVASTKSYPYTYSNPNVDADTDTEPGTSEDAELVLEKDTDPCLDSEAEQIRKDIEQFKAEGPAKPNHTNHTKKLWKREGEFWERYCHKIDEIKDVIKKSPEERLDACEPEMFKAYLRWRKKHSRVKKESSMRSYWKRLSMCYMNITGHRMDPDILTDICNWIPTLMLDRAEKEKHAMYVQDLYAILHALWVDDTKPLHGFVRVQISLLLLLSAATATRPGAIALSFKNIELLKVRSVVESSQSTIVANVNLENVKNKEKDGKPKKFTFRLEGTPAFCIVSYILSIGIRHEALRDEFSSVQDIFNMNIPADRDVLRIKWKKELLTQPFLCDVRNTVEGVRILKQKAFPYAKYRDTFVRLGRLAGFEEPLELYQLRRASGRNINSALDPVERNQTMGHLGSTYEKYYTPTHIARDFQSIYFGSPSEALLIESVARMGLSRDRRAPTELDDEQQEKLRKDPALIILRNERQVYKNQLYDRKFYPLVEGEGTDLYKKYEDTKRKIGSTYQTFTIAGMLFKPIQGDNSRALKRKRVDSVLYEPTGSNYSNKRKTGAEGIERSSPDQDGEIARDERDAPHREDFYPVQLPHPVCLICIGNVDFAYDRRMQRIPRKDVLTKHVKKRFRLPELQSGFTCRHPSCSDKLFGEMHFMRHALDVHAVSH